MPAEEKEAKDEEAPWQSQLFLLHLNIIRLLSSLAAWKKAIFQTNLMSPGCDTLKTCSCEVLKDPSSKEKGGNEDGNYGVGVPDKLSVIKNVVYFLIWRGGMNKAGASEEGS